MRFCLLTTTTLHPPPKMRFCSLTTTTPSPHNEVLLTDHHHPLPKWHFPYWPPPPPYPLKWGLTHWPPPPPSERNKILIWYNILEWGFAHWPPFEILFVNFGEDQTLASGQNRVTAKNCPKLRGVFLFHYHHPLPPVSLSLLPPPTPLPEKISRLSYLLFCWHWLSVTA